MSVVAYAFAVLAWFYVIRLSQRIESLEYRVGSLQSKVYKLEGKP